MMKRFRNQRGAALIETAITIPLLPIAQRWGGGPSNEDWMVEGAAPNPSTTRLRRAVPLPASCARREER